MSDIVHTETELQAFATEVAKWLKANCPSAMREPMRGEADVCWGGMNFQFKSEAQRVWLERMAAKGWSAPTWPVEYGGGGLSRPQAKILRLEMERLGCRDPLMSLGLGLLGPALLKYGSEDQKREHLPKIARGEIRWCMGYSEPSAGSDLVSLRTRAEDMGDHFLINGQKIWTSYAHESDWIYCLVRTDADAPKHNGISFLIFDMKTSGTEARPIKLISGDSEFCETFFDNVIVPKSALVGEVNKGWEVAKYLLTQERESVGNADFIMNEERPLDEVARDCLAFGAEGQLEDKSLRLDIVRFLIDQAAYDVTVERINDSIRAGENTGPLSSMLKNAITELKQRRSEINLGIYGGIGLRWSADIGSEYASGKQWLRARGNTIEGGTAEVQWNVIAKRVLELPA
jgi:acyl-CoA dehydrogenase